MGPGHSQRGEGTLVEWRTFVMSIRVNCAFRHPVGRAPIPKNCSGKSPCSVDRPPWVYEGSDGVLMLYNGVTRATRIAKLAPSVLIHVEVIGKLPRAFAGEPKIGDLLS